MLRLILAVSADGYLADGPDDDMGWTGRADKAVFRLLTSVGDGACAAGLPTWRAMPDLEGRRVIPLSRRPLNVAKDLPLVAPTGEALRGSTVTVERSMTLDEYASAHPTGWLLGGPRIALEALRADLVGQVYLCRSRVELRLSIGETWSCREDAYQRMRPYADRVTPVLEGRAEPGYAGVPWARAQRIGFGDVKVDVWSRADARRPHP